MRTSFSKLSLLALPLAALTACQDYEPFSEAEVREAMTSREYAENFASYFGEIDQNHNWGFFEIPSMPSFSAETRAQSGGAGSVLVNRNQWPDKSGDEYNSQHECLSKYMSIPGWPNLDGFYYEGAQHNVLNYLSSGTTGSPAGDVTDYEISLVSEWFRTTKITNPEDYRANLHICDFFIQDVSSDVDRKDDGTPKYSDTNTFAMDQLRFATMNSSNDPSDETWTHVNDFNHDSQNYKPQDRATTPWRTIMYVKSSGTEDFAYHPSDNDNSTFYDKWVLVHLEWDEVMHDGKLHHREGYYLAFDYESHKSDGTNIECDNYYSNWIVKITPANYIPQQNKIWPRRVMCEDLGNTLDYDFNDVVFDVMFQKNSETTSEAVITIQAAGGTLPIYVGVEPTEANKSYEAHKMLGYNGTTNLPPINAGPGTKSHAVAIYRLSSYIGEDGNPHNFAADANDPDLIKIYVGTSTNKATGVVETYRQIAQNNRGTNNAPQKFSCPNDVLWMQEWVFINDGYPHFPDWVRESDGNYKEDGSSPWFSTGINASKLCGQKGEGVVIEESGSMGGHFYIKAKPFKSSSVTKDLAIGDSFSLNDFINEGAEISGSPVVDQDGTVIEVSDKTVTACGHGTATITMNCAGNQKFDAGSITITVNVTAKNPFTVNSIDPIEMALGETDPIDLSQYVKDGIIVTSTSSKVEVATISDLKINAVGEGDATITLSYEGDSEYSEASLEISVHVIDPSKAPYRFIELTGDHDASEFGTKQSYTGSGDFSFSGSSFPSDKNKIIITFVTSGEYNGRLFDKSYQVAFSEGVSMSKSGIYQVIINRQDVYSLAKNNNLGLATYGSFNVDLYLKCE